MNRRYCDAIWSGMKDLTTSTCRVANYILSKPQWIEVNRQYCDGRLSGMNALTAQRFISVQSHEPRWNGSTVRFFDILVYICEA